MSGRGGLTNPGGGSQARLWILKSRPTSVSGRRNRYSEMCMRGILLKSALPDYSYMSRNRAESLIPRKKPQQRRSRVTIDTIFEAAIQVLLANGLDRSTTIQITECAGVSVCSLYQYFPSTNALLAALVKRHVGEVHDMTIAACKWAHGKCIAEMCASMLSAFVGAKSCRLEVSRALSMPS